ncbi:hypothetical protein [Bifidobacterium pseudolongum]|uniref:Uncharacterized protein n=1 Tax=Bifidobacterium pseudolongum subsp. globosum TaxID=1690 RepID=A0A2N3QVK4_9BIFI|nr:hypothetical protein [Bifidobacterium pseudolongum]PKU96175.1 hypothetical protein CQR45_0297 [Bifidobacterium pseudolongum subsp. globosum]
MNSSLHERLKPVATLLDTLLPIARMHAVAALDAMHATPTKNKDIYARCLRTALRELLLDSDLPQYGWVVVDKSNSLHLFDQKAGLTIRFLKAFDKEGSIPPAGSNNARRRAWSQTSLFDQHDDTDDRPQSLWGIELVCTWVEDDEQITCRVLQPISTGQWPDRAEAKTIMTLSHAVERTDLDDISFNGTESNAHGTVEEERLSIRTSPQQTQTRSKAQ